LRVHGLELLDALLVLDRLGASLVEGSLQVAGHCLCGTQLLLQLGSSLACSLGALLRLHKLVLKLA
jgi:hypothetical protein